MNIRVRKPIMAGNWKLNKLASEIAPYLMELSAAMPAEKACEAVICAPFPLLSALQEGGVVSVGAEDVSAFEHGAYTGEVSAEQLRDLGMRWCIVGHSERRSYHGETDFAVNAKAKRLLQNGVTPIVCVGESEQQRGMGVTREYIAYQTAAAFSGIPAVEARTCVVAYEPLWAIGTGNTATAAQAEEVCAAIRQVVSGLYDAETADAVRILYGGSMKPANAAELLAQPDIDGGLIGGASLKPAEFAKLVAAASEA